jgi:hypothetical protein
MGKVHRKLSEICRGLHDAQSVEIKYGEEG